MCLDDSALLVILSVLVMSQGTLRDEVIQKARVNGGPSKPHTVTHVVGLVVPRIGLDGVWN